MTRNDKPGHKAHPADSLTFSTSCFAPCLSVLFPLQVMFSWDWPPLLFRSCCGSLRLFYLSPLQNNLSWFSLKAWLLSLWACWHSSSFPPPICLREPVTPAHSSFCLKPPAGSRRHLCLWLLQHTPLFASTVQLAPADGRKTEFTFSQRVLWVCVFIWNKTGLKKLNFPGVISPALVCVTYHLKAKLNTAWVNVLKLLFFFFFLS